MRLDAARLRDLGIVFGVPLLFATNMAIGRSVIGEVAPWTLAFLRWSLAFGLALPFAAAGLWRARAQLLAQAPMIVLQGFLGMWICGGIVYVALGYTTATNATLIYAASNVLILLLEWAFRGRRIGWREMAGTVLAIAGVAVIALGSAGEANGDAAWRLNPGDLLIGVAALSWAGYSVLLKRPGLAALPSLPLFAAITLAGALLLLPMMLWEVASGPALPRTPTIWLAALGLAFMPSLGAFFGYQLGIRRFGPATMAMTSYLWTPYGLGLAVIFLGESLRPHHMLALLLILPGVVLATVWRRLNAEPPL